MAHLEEIGERHGREGRRFTPPEAPDNPSVDELREYVRGLEAYRRGFDAGQDAYRVGDDDKYPSV